MISDAASQGNLPVKGATADHEGVAHELRRTGHEVNVISMVLSVRVGGYDDVALRCDGCDVAQPGLDGSALSQVVDVLQHSSISSGLPEIFGAAPAASVVYDD